jgi:hypothetical protein
MMSGLSENDLRRLLDVVQDGRRDDPTAGVPWAVLERLPTLIRCDDLSWNDLDVDGERCALLQYREGSEQVLDLAPDPDGLQAYWQHHRAFRPCDSPAPHGHSARRWSDFYTARELRSTALHTECFGPDGVTDCLFIGLPTATGHARRLLFWRAGGRGSSVRDALLLEVLRPHLGELVRDSQLRSAAFRG